jgi:hypothetical protein
MESIASKDSVLNPNKPNEMKKQAAILTAAIMLCMILLSATTNKLVAQDNCYLKVTAIKTNSDKTVEDVDIKASVGETNIDSKTTDEDGVALLKVPVGGSVDIQTTNQRFRAYTTVSTADAKAGDTIEVTLTIGPRAGGGTTAIGVVIMDDDKTKPAAGVALTLIGMDDKTIESATTTTTGSFNFINIKNGISYKIRGVVNNTTVLNTTFTYTQGTPVLLSFPTK